MLHSAIIGIVMNRVPIPRQLPERNQVIVRELNFGLELGSNLNTTPARFQVVRSLCISSFTISRLSHIFPPSLSSVPFECRRSPVHHHLLLVGFQQFMKLFMSTVKHVRPGVSL
uniref:Uncharacterized protein n=1 Tax=Cacopsylla melanoneura TaxID=428564 RepID=A0A8D8WMB6_9HEMI